MIPDNYSMLRFQLKYSLYMNPIHPSNLVTFSNLTVEKRYQIL